MIRDVDRILPSNEPTSVRVAVVVGLEAQASGGQHLFKVRLCVRVRVVRHTDESSTLGRFDILLL
jgi:hypothetical protein